MDCNQNKLNFQAGMSLFLEEPEVFGNISRQWGETEYVLKTYSMLNFSEIFLAPIGMCMVSYITDFKLLNLIKAIKIYTQFWNIIRRKMTLSGLYTTKV